MALSHEPLRAPALTPRQREVLEMLARGRSNPEIAQALGITLAGAKWHVSEVISRLNVDSREEAADAWREQNRLPRRVSRTFSGLFGALSWKAAVLVAGGMAMATAAVVVVITVSASSRENAGAADPPSPAFNEAEARDRARYIAGEYLKQTDLPQRTEIGGHQLGIDDLSLAELVYVPAGGTLAFRTSTNSSGQAREPTWGAVFRREGIPMPDMGWDDGVVSVSTFFADGTGKVLSASAKRSSKARDLAAPSPVPTTDPALRERAGALIPVLRVDGQDWHSTLNVYQTRGGEWCWWDASDSGSGGGGCALDPAVGPSPDIFGVSGSSAGTEHGQTRAGYLYGALSTRVERVEIALEHGDAVEAAAADFPAETGLPWRAFGATLPAGSGAVLFVRAFASDGSEIARYDLSHGPTIPPYVVMPLDYIDFSGDGDKTGGVFRLPPPAFPVKIALLAAHDDSGPITADLLCDTGTVRILDEPGAVGALNGSLVIDLPPDATTCTFDVHAIGHWSFVTK